MVLRGQTYPNNQQSIGGGGGLVFRSPPDEFTGATLAACRTARDTYFNNASNADALAEFQGNQSIAIILNPTSSISDTFETYLPGNEGEAYDSTQWEDRTDAVQGNPGDDGSQGRFYLSIHTNSTAQPTPATPIGGSYVLGTGVFTPPTGTTEDPTRPGTGEDIWVSQAEIDPDTQSGTVTPTWSEWVERSHLSAGISHVESTDDFGGQGTVANPLSAAATLARILDLGGSPTQTTATFAYAAPIGYTAGGFLSTGQFIEFNIGIVSSPDDSDVIIRVGTDDYSLTSLGGLSVKVHELIDDTKYLAFGKDTVLVLIGPGGSGEVVDVTESGLPAPDESSVGKIFTNRLIPAAWMVHEVVHAVTPVMGSFGSYTSPRNSGDTFDLYRGAHGADPTSVRVGTVDQTLDSRHVGAFYWNWRDNAFRVWVSTFNQQTSTFVYHWQASHYPADRLVSGGTGEYIGHAITDDDLLRHLPQDTINSSRTYVGVATNNSGNGVIHVRTFDNSTYVAAIGAFNVYDFVTVGLYGSGGTAGQTKAQVDADIQTAINSLIDGAPANRNTLNELSDAIDGLSGDISGVTAGVGLTGGGDSGDVTLDIDPSETDFPTIPLDKGGTGATDADAARTNLGLGTAAEANTGIAENNVPILDANGHVPDSLLPDELARDSEVADSFIGASKSGNDITLSRRSGSDPIVLSVGSGTGGFTLRFGAGAPSSSLGDNGDWYINTTTGGFSEKVSGAWEVRYTDQVGASGGLSEAQVDGRIDILSLRQAQNLADLNDAATGRTNLGLGTAAVQDSGTGAGDVLLLDSNGRILVANLPTAVQNAVRSFSYNTAQPQRLGYTEVDGTQAFITLSRLAALTGAVFTGVVQGVTPVDDADLTRKDYVDTANNLALKIAQNLADLADIATARTNLGLGTAATHDTGTVENDLALLESGGVFAVTNIPNLGATYAAFADGGTFTTHLGGITPTIGAHFATKGYVDGLVNPVQAHTNYAALKTTNAFVTADFTAAGSSASSMTSAITVPEFTVASYLAFAVPDVQPDLTDIRETGSAFSSFSSFERVSGTIMIGGEAHKVWRSTIEFLANSAQSWTIT